jgi:hypothetical protein
MGFSGGGFLLPYHLGAYQSLAAMGIVSSATPMAGSSAGSLVRPTTCCLDLSLRNLKFSRVLGRTGVRDLKETACCVYTAALCISPGAHRHAQPLQGHTAVTCRNCQPVNRPKPSLCKRLV